MTPLECERIQGFPDDWTIPKMKIDDLDRLDSLRYTATGNAVTVSVAKWLGQRIISTLQPSAAIDSQSKKKRIIAAG